MRFRPRAESVVLAVVIAAFVAVYLYLLRDVGIAGDEWTWLLYLIDGYSHFSAFTTLVGPYNHQPILSDLLIYKGWASTVGVAHHWVLDFFLVLLHAGVVALVYALARRRVDGWTAVGCALLVLVMGRAWEALLFPASLTFVMPTVALCVGWWAIDEERSTMILGLAAGLLAFASLSGGLAVAVAAAIWVEVVAAKRWRGVGLALASVVPLIVWYVREHPATGLSLSANLRHLPEFALRYLESAAGGILGFSQSAGATVLVVAIVVVVLARRFSEHRRSLRSPRFISLLVALAVAALTTGAAHAAQGSPVQSRYVYFPAVVMILLACEVVAGVKLRVRRASPVLAGILVALAAVLGARQFRDGKVHYRAGSDATAAQMGAMLLVDGPAHLTQAGGLAYSPASLQRFARRYGRAPIYDVRRIADSLPASRAAVDRLLAQVDVHEGGPTKACVFARSGAELPRRGATVVIGSSRPQAAQLVRFADPGSGVVVPVRPPRVELSVRPDPIVRDWRILAPQARVSICS